LIADEAVHEVYPLTLPNLDISFVALKVRSGIVIVNGSTAIHLFKLSTPFIAQVVGQNIIIATSMSITVIDFKTLQQTTSPLQKPNKFFAKNWNAAVLDDDVIYYKNSTICQQLKKDRFRFARCPGPIPMYPVKGYTSLNGVLYRKQGEYLVQLDSVSQGAAKSASRPCESEVQKLAS